MFDLHFHSLASDGKASLAALAAACAARPELRCLALADHDHVASSVAFAALEPRALVAIELTAALGQGAPHLLALDLRPDDPQLVAYLELRRLERQERLSAWAELLRAQGLRFELDPAVADSASFGKPHIVEELRRHAENAALLPPALDDPAASDPIYTSHLKVGGKADISKLVPNRLIELPEAIALVRAAGGLSFLAHPLTSLYLTGQKRDGADWRLGAPKAERTIAALAEAGLDGLEVFAHGQEEPEFVEVLLDLALRHGLLVSAGSDDHSVDGAHIGGALAADDPRAAGYLAAIEERLRGA
jgi:predicted metal-dependent phosphoesterase TrpH